MYEVQAIIKKSEFPDGTKYLVRWKGWSAAHDTWEPVEHLTKELLAEFAEELDEEASASEDSSEDDTQKKRQRP